MTVEVDGLQVKTVTLRGLDFSYTEWGCAGSPAMVLLHGLTGHARTWDVFANALQREYHIFALDQRGHGDTGWPNPPQYDTDDFVEDLRSLADHWGIAGFVLIGLSMGAHNSLAFAAKYPEMVERLVPVDIGPTLPRLDEPEMKARLDRLYREFETIEDAYADAIENSPIADQDMIRHRARHSLKRTEDGRWAPKHTSEVALHWKPDDLSDTIRTIQCPTLLVRGGLSEVLSPEVAESMTEAMPDCRLVTIGGSGHSVPQDKPAEFELAVREFLAQ